MKRLGRLVGNIGVGSATSDAPPSTRHPYTATSPGAKLVQHGELALNDGINRALYAIQSNLEESTSAPLRVLPALLEPAGSTYGFTSLTAVARGTRELPLGSGAHAPPVWLYHGVKASDTPAAMALVRKDVLTSTTSRALDVLRPIGVLGRTGGDYVTDPVSGSPDFLLGDSALNGVANYIAPSVRVRSDIAPYDGATQSMTILSVDYDGFVVDSAEGYSFKELHGCAGVLVEIANTTDLDGLYRVERVVPVSATQEKLVVSSCGFHAVRVEDASDAIPGRLVRWAARPDATESNATALPFAAYIVAVVGDTLYLSAFADVSDASGELAGTDNGVQQLGSLGDVDVEFSDNTLLAANMFLHQDDVVLTVVSVQRAGAPLILPSETLDGAVGYVRNPLGFSLSPVVVLDSTPILRGGDYYLECRILAGVGHADMHESRSRSWHRSLSALETRAALRYMVGVRDGDASVDSDIAKFSTPAQQMLGPSVWVVTVTKTSGTATNLESIVTEGSTSILFDNRPNSGTSSTATRARVLQCTGNVAHLRAVSKGAWDHRADQLLEPIVAGAAGTGSTFTLSGSTFRVTTIHVSPAVTHPGGATRTVSSALQAAYDNSFMSDAQMRGNGYGRKIEIHEGYPIQLLATTAGNLASCVEVIADSEFVSAIRTKIRTGGLHNTVTSDWGYESTDGTAYIRALNSQLSLRSSDGTRRGQFYFPANSLGFADRNTGFDASDVVYLSATAPYNALCYGFKSKTVLGALYGVDHTARESAQPNVRSAVGSGVLRSDHKRLIYSAEPFEYSLHFNASLSSTTATWVGPSGAAGVTVGENLLVQYQDADGNIQTFVTTLTGANGIGVSFADVFPSELEDTTVSAGIYKGRLDRVYVAEGEYIIAGRRFRIPASSLLHAQTDATMYAVYSEATAIVSLTDTPPAARGGADGALVETLAVIEIADGAVTAITQVARPIIREQNTPVLYVGKFIEHDDAELSYNAGLTHFETLGEAFTFIEANASLDGAVETGWVIRVVTDVEETENTTLGITLPLRIPCNGLTIEGAGEAAVVSWSTQTHLLYLAAKADLTIRNINFSYTGDYDAIRALSWIPDAGDGVLIPGPPVSVLVGITECDNARLLDCSITGGAIACLHVSATSSTFTCQRVVATSCRAGVFMYAHGAFASAKLIMTDVSVSASGVFDTGRATALTAVNLKSGVTVNNLHANNIAAILASGFQNFTANGVYVDGDPVESNVIELTSSRAGASAMLTATTLTLAQDSETSHYGVYIDEVDSTTLDGLAISGGVVGVRMAGSGSFNTLRISNASISFASGYAIDATGGSETLVANATLANCAGGVLLTNGSARLDNVTMRLTGVPENTAEAPSEGFCGAYVTGSGVLRIANSDIKVEHAFGGHLVGYGVKTGGNTTTYVSNSSIHGGVTAITAGGRIELTAVACTNRTAATASAASVVSLGGDDSTVDGIDFTADVAVTGSCLVAAAVSGVRISGVRATATKSHVIHLSDCANVRVSDVIIHGASRTSLVYLQNCSDCAVAGVSATGHGDSVGTDTVLRLTGCEGFSVSDVVVALPGDTSPISAPVAFNTCQRGTVTNVVTNDVSMSVGYGAVTFTGCAGIQVTGCYLYHGMSSDDYGLRLSNCNGLRFSNCTFRAVELSACTGNIEFSTCEFDKTDETTASGLSISASGGSAYAHVVSGEIKGDVMTSDISLELVAVEAADASVAVHDAAYLVVTNVTALGALTFENVTTTRLSNVVDDALAVRAWMNADTNDALYVTGCKLLTLGCPSTGVADFTDDRVEALEITNSTIGTFALEVPATSKIVGSSFGSFNLFRRSGGMGSVYVGKVTGCRINRLYTLVTTRSGDYGGAYPQNFAETAPFDLAAVRFKFVGCDFSGEWSDGPNEYGGTIDCDAGVSIYNSVVANLGTSVIAKYTGEAVSEVTLADYPFWGNTELNDSEYAYFNQGVTVRNLDVINVEHAVSASDEIVIKVPFNLRVVDVLVTAKSIISTTAESANAVTLYRVTGVDAPVYITNNMDLTPIVFPGAVVRPLTVRSDYAFEKGVDRLKVVFNKETPTDTNQVSVRIVVQRLTIADITSL